MKLFSFSVHLIIILVGFKCIAFEVREKPEIFKFEKSLLPVSEMSFCELIPDSNSRGKMQFELELPKCKFLTRPNWNFSFTNKIIWTKFKLQNSSILNLKKVILINHIYLSQIQIFERGTDQKEYLTQTIGLDAPVISGEKTTSGFAFKVDIPSNSEKEFLLRVQSKFPISLPLYIMNPIDYENYTTSIRYILIFYIAFVTALMLYNLILFLVTRELAFFYYILTILGLHIFTNLAQYGIIKEFFVPNFLFLHKNTFHFAHLFSLFSVTFFIFGFFKENLDSRSKKYFIFTSSLTVPLTLFGIWSDSYYADLLMQVNTTLFCLYLLYWSTYQTFVKKLKLARYFSIAWTFIIISWILNFLKIDGLVVNNIINDSFILIGAGLECLLLSLALADRIRTLTKERNEAFSKLTLTEERNKIFRQISHDIRSPLSALAMLTDRLSALPEESRILLRSSVNRINDIANQLLAKSKDSFNSSTEVKFRNSSEEDVLISSLIDVIVSEKRLQYHERINIQIIANLNSSSYGLFAKVNPVEFKRVISNLINNAVEAMPEQGGQVSISIINIDRQIHLVVEDDGQGIPIQVLPLLTEHGYTFGKSSGSGLGLYHARLSVESWAGSLSIQSQLGVGTKVQIKLPLISTPSWFVSELQVSYGSTIVILDDDPSVHGIWCDRLKRFDLESSNIAIAHFSTPSEFREWVTEHRQINPIIYLCDFELLGFKETGLELIESLQLGMQSILVTSRFEEQSILSDCIQLGIKLIPKGMAGFVPITIVEPKRVLDGILIDDDTLIHNIWEMAARSADKKIAIFKNHIEFFKHISTFSLVTPIYIDSNLDNGVRGEVIANEIYKYGFREIYLATGYESSHFSNMPWICKIVPKDPPWR